MIKSLRDKCVVLAPMAGITDFPMRQQVREHGVDLAYSEMLASRELLQRPIALQRRVHIDGEAGKLAVQIAGCEPYWMAEAARMCADLGAAIIDINMGCPAKKVVKGAAAGSALMRDLPLAEQLIAATVRAVSLPVTLKMRTGWDAQNRNAPELARMAEDLGIRSLTVHGRTRCQFYKGHADWEFIGEVKQSVGIPVIANGDILSEQDAVQALAQSGADGVMIGRGAQGRPWFPAQVRHFLTTGDRLAPPSEAQQHQIMIRHYRAILSHYGEALGVRVARKHLGWYLSGRPGGEDLRRQVVRMQSPDEVLRALERHFAHINMRAAA